MTEVTYLIKKPGVKGSAKRKTLAEAQAEAKRIGGYYEAVYTPIVENEDTPERIKRREKTMKHFGIKSN